MEGNSITKDIECPSCGVIQGVTFDPSNHFPSCERRITEEDTEEWFCRSLFGVKCSPIWNDGRDHDQCGITRSV